MCNSNPIQTPNISTISNQQYLFSISKCYCSLYWVMCYRKATENLKADYKPSPEVGTKKIGFVVLSCRIQGVYLQLLNRCGEWDVIRKVGWVHLIPWLVQWATTSSPKLLIRFKFFYQFFFYIIFISFLPSWIDVIPEYQESTYIIFNKGQPPFEHPILTLHHPHC